MNLEKITEKERLEKVKCTNINCESYGDKPICYMIFYEGCDKNQIDYKEVEKWDL